MYRVALILCLVGLACDGEPADGPTSGRSAGGDGEHEPPPAEADTPMGRALARSATGPRLHMAGLTERSDDLDGLPGADELGATGALRAARPDGTAYAHAYYFESGEARRGASDRLDAIDPPADGEADVVGNGAFLVRVVVTGEDAHHDLLRMVGTIAGEE